MPSKKVILDERWEGNTEKKTAKYLVNDDVYDARKRSKFIKPKQGGKTDPSFELGVKSVHCALQC